MDKQVKVIHVGRGEVVSNWGTYEGSPAVFIEPVVGNAGTIGEKVTEGVQPQIVNDGVSDGGVVIVIHDKAGLDVLLEDFASAIGASPSANEKAV